MEKINIWKTQFEDLIYKKIINECEYYDSKFSVYKRYYLDYKSLEYRLKYIKMLHFCSIECVDGYWQKVLCKNCKINFNKIEQN